MTDYLDRLAASALQTIKKGYYRIKPKKIQSTPSLHQNILQCPLIPVISELKFASPSRGVIRTDNNIPHIISQMEQGGVIGISVLTEPQHFQGQLSYIAQVRQLTFLPTLMKDFIIDPVQITAAQNIGASAILLIQALYDRGYSNHTVDQMIQFAHDAHLEVLLETHSIEEFASAILTNADMVGINNRDLRSLKVDTHLTESILAKHDSLGKTIVSESGFHEPGTLVKFRTQGVHAFLIGTSIMEADDLKAQVKQFVDAS